MKNELIERFTRYVKVDTQSDDSSETTPSTGKQFDLANMLVDELRQIGMSDVTMDDHAYVMATLPANSEKELPTIGFLSHIDTSPDFSGKNVNPQIHEDYDGNDIQLNNAITLSTEAFPELSGYKGDTLVTTDGTTLLGADDKAGITEIMTAMAYLINHPDIKHGTIRVAFTPDEEIGRGPHKFDVERFQADYAYTVDGGPLGELQYESFNAAGAKVAFKGNSVHPGTAKGKMVNAGRMAAEFIGLFPEDETPENTDKYDGFFHLLTTNGNVENTEVTYIIRDFDKANFQKRKEQMEANVKAMQAKYGEERVELTMKDQYYNMGEKIKPVKEIVDIAHQAMENLDIKPIVQPIRGGTDGAQLSYMGLPTPNLFAGGENFHGKFEYVSVDTMEKATNVIVEICQLFEKQYKA